MTTNNMEMLTILQLENGATIVKARYLDDGRGACYHFKNVLGLELNPGDLMVAETRDTFALLEVVDPEVMVTDLGCQLYELKHVVAKVKNDAYMNVKKAENNAIRKLALSEVTGRLQSYREQVGSTTFDEVATMLAAPMVFSYSADDDEVIEQPDVD